MTDQQQVQRQELEQQREAQRIADQKRAEADRQRLADFYAAERAGRS